MTTPVPASTPWVPMWSLQGGVAINYLGGWAPGTYQPGQIVVDNGVEYMCVRQTTKRPTPWAASQAASYGTSLPANPIDGQEAVLVDSLTNPSYQWRFRYNANSTSIYKWEYIGGSPAVSAYGGSDPVATGWNAVSNPPAVGFPRNGEYLFEYSAMFNAASGSTLVGLGIGISGSLAGNQAHGVPNAVAGGANYVQLAAVWNMLIVTSAQYAQHILYAGATGMNVNQRYLAVQPKRVS
jgi:hypothetical protein